MRRYSAFDKTIEVEYRALPTLLWLGVGFEVHVGDRVFHAPPRRLTFFGHAVTGFEVTYRGGRVAGMVRGVGSRWSVFRKRYSVVVGLSELGRETQTLRGWLPCVLMMALLYAVVALALLVVIR